jgi:hypothetical protein
LFERLIIDFIYWLFKMKCFGCQHFIIWHKPVLLALNTNLSILRLTTINQ